MSTANAPAAPSGQICKKQLTELWVNKKTYAEKWAIYNYLLIDKYLLVYL